MATPIDVDAELRFMFSGPTPEETPEKVFEEQAADLAKKVEEFLEILRKNKSSFASSLDKILEEFSSFTLTDELRRKEADRIIVGMDQAVRDKKGELAVLSDRVMMRGAVLEEKQQHSRALCTALSDLKQNVAAMPRYSGVQRFLSAIIIDSKKK